MNYIKFENKPEFLAEIHSNGKVRIIKNPNHLKKLLEICNKYENTTTTEFYIKNHVEEIKKEYEKFYQKRKSTINVYNKISATAKLNKNKKLAKTIMAFGTFIALATITPNNNSNNVNNESIVNEINENSLEEQINEEEIFENTSNEVNYLEDRVGLAKLQLDTILSDNTPNFIFDYKNDNLENFENTKRYEEIFEKYGQMYGISPNLLMAIASQESGGNHFDYLYGYPAIGIMQIESSVFCNSKISAYNFLEDKEETLLITDENIRDLDTNIKIGAMLLQYALEYNNYNIPLGIQTYNFGTTNIDTVLNSCEQISGISTAQMKNDMNENEWRYYREFLNIGDSQYVEHVLSYLPNEKITVKNRANQSISLNIKNEAQEKKTVK